MEEKTNYTVVGIIVLILICGLLSAALWLSVGFNQKEYANYTVYLSEAAAGLTEESAVKFNGVQVGLVKKIELNKNDPRKVEITLSIEKDIPITTSTTATLISQGITGVTYVGLAAGSSDLTPIKKMPDEPYPVIPARPSLFNQLDALLKEVAVNVNKVSAQTQRIFNEENAKNIAASLDNLRQFSDVIANNSKDINNTIHSTDLFLANMAKISKDFPQMMSELKGGIRQFNAMAGDISKAGISVTKTMGSGKDSFDKLSQQAIPPAVTLLHRLNDISANLEKVSNELRQNPSIMLRGTQPPKPGPGE